MSDSLARRVEFRVLAKPLPQPRPRFANRGGFARAYTPKTVMGHDVKAYQEAIRLAAQSACEAPWEDPLTVEVHVAIQPPQSLLKADGTLRPSARPFPTAARDGDADNYFKLIADALHDIAYLNDSQIVGARATKRWALEEPEGCHVVLTRLE